MAYLAGHGVTLTLGGGPDWDGHITSVRHKQTKDHTQVKVCGQAHANTVSGAYHTVYTVGFAVPDNLSVDHLEIDNAVNSTGTLSFAYATGDTLALTDMVVTDIEINGEVEGAVLGTIELQGNSAMAHAVT